MNLIDDANFEKLASLGVINPNFYKSILSVNENGQSSSHDILVSFKEALNSPDENIGDSFENILIKILYGLIEKTLFFYDDPFGLITSIDVMKIGKKLNETYKKAEMWLSEMKTKKSDDDKAKSFSSLFVETKQLFDIYIRLIEYEKALSSFQSDPEHFINNFSSLCSANQRQEKKVKKIIQKRNLSSENIILSIKNSTKNDLKKIMSDEAKFSVPQSYNRFDNLIDNDDSLKPMIISAFETPQLMQRYLRITEIIKSRKERFNKIKSMDNVPDVIFANEKRMLSESLLLDMISKKVLPENAIEKYFAIKNKPDSGTGVDSLKKYNEMYDLINDLHEHLAF